MVIGESTNTYMFVLKNLYSYILKKVLRNCENVTDNRVLNVRNSLYVGYFEETHQRELAN